MPVDKQVLIRYKVLDECFRHRSYTFPQLLKACNEALEKRDYPPVSERTVRSDISRLQYEPFNVELDDTLRQGHSRVYHYADENCESPLAQWKDDALLMVEDTIAIFSQTKNIPQYQYIADMLTRIKAGMSVKEECSFVSFQNNPDLVGIDYFMALYKAISDKQTIKIVYKPYQSDALTYDASPYYLKQYNERWYVICKVPTEDHYMHFALDRIVSVTKSKITYLPDNTDFEEYFSDVVGVTITNNPIENIKLRITNNRFPYVATKPIHWSQTELHGEQNAYSHVIQLKVRVNSELIAHILYLGNDVEVLEPLTLRNVIKEKIAAMADNYR